MGWEGTKLFRGVKALPLAQSHIGTAGTECWELGRLGWGTGTSEGEGWGTNAWGKVAHQGWQVSTVINSGEAGHNHSSIEQTHP